MTERRHHPRADAAVAAVLFVANLVFFVVARDEAEGAVERDIVGQAGFPSAVAVCAMAVTSYLFVRAAVRLRQGSVVAADGDPRWRPWAMWLLAIAYVILLRVIGFVLATTGFVWAGLVLIGFERTKRAPVVAVSTTVALYLIFGVFLGVDLPLLPGAG